MNLWCIKALKQILARNFTIFWKWLVILVLVLNISSCTEKAISQDVPVNQTEERQPISRQFTEVAPPDVIQELRSSLEVYRPQVSIVTPEPDKILQNTQVTVRFQVKDLPIFQDPKFQLGPHLHIFLDNQPVIPLYDLNQPLVLYDLSPGTHTLRVLATYPWHESFKNEGAYAQTTFHIFTKTDDNSPDLNLPLLTYNVPDGSYGAEPILLDFYLTNAPLRLGAQDEPDSPFSDWRIRCTINGESFVFDRWQAVYLKGFNPGNNWVKLEFLDNQGNAVKNAFNTTVRLVNYLPNGKDAFSRITRGELKADEVRSIVDQSYTTKPSVPEPQPQEEQKPIPTPEIPEVVEPQPTKLPQPEVTPTPQATELPEPQPEVTPIPQVTESPEPKVTEQPTPEAQPEVTPSPQVTISPTPEAQPEVTPSPQVTISPTPEVQPEVTPSPQVTISPTPEAQPEVTPSPQVTISPTPETQPEVTPTPETKEVPAKPEIQPLKSRLSKYFQRSPLPTPSEVTPIPQATESPEPQPEVTPSPEVTQSPEKQETD